MKIFHKNEIFTEVDRAETHWERTKGLMFRNIENKEGLFFVFPDEKKWSIWMPFVPQDLAVFWLDGEGVVVDKKIARKVSLNPLTWKTYNPEEECKYVLECDKNKIDKLKVGERLSWDKNE